MTSAMIYVTCVSKLPQGFVKLPFEGCLGISPALLVLIQAAALLIQASLVAGSND